MIKDLPPPLKTVDKRIQRTKIKLLESFVSLIVERGYTNVTVQDILDKAKVGKSTFYAHFENKEQILKGDNMMRLLVTDDAFIGKTSRCDINFLRLYNHVRENKHFAHEIFGKEMLHMISDHIKNVFIFALQSYLKQRIRSNVDKPMLALMTESAGAALMTLLISWALKGMPRPPQLMADKSQQIVDSFLKDFMI